MRFLLLAVVGLTACTADNPQFLHYDERIAALEAKQSPAGAVASLQTQNAALAQRVAQLEDVVTKMAAMVHVPHLWTVDGKDLGPFVGYDAAWSEQLGAYYDLSGANVVYQQKNCTGAPMLTTPGGGFDYAIASNGHIAKTGGAATQILVASVFGDGACANYNTPGPGSAIPLIDTGVDGAFRPSRANLRVR